MTNKYNDYTNDELDREVAERLGIPTIPILVNNPNSTGITTVGYNYYPISTSMDSCIKHVIPAMYKVHKCSHFRLECLDEGKLHIAEFMFPGENCHGNECRYEMSNLEPTAGRATSIAALMVIDAMEEPDLADLMVPGGTGCIKCYGLGCPSCEK